MSFILLIFAQTTYIMKQAVFTQNTLDATTGELVQKVWLTKEVKNTQHFVKLYLEDLASLHHLTHSDFRTLHSVAEFLEYNTNQFFLNKERREQLAVNAKVKINTINQCISRLTRKNLLIKLSSGLYQMNPKIFFNGDEMARAKYLEVVIRYNICQTC